MKTPEEIKKGLECCQTIVCCGICPYHDIGEIAAECTATLTGDAFELIKQLESSLAQVEKERDAAVSDMRTAVKTNAVCIACKHDRPFDNNCEENDFDCANCKSPCMCQSCHLGNNYEWRGICAENSKEE